MPQTLSYLQRDIFNLIGDIKSEQRLKEIKSLLTEYLSFIVVIEADRAFEQKGYQKEVFEKWLFEHFRKQSF